MSGFITTSDIIKRLNESLDDTGEFQLHTRLPDGSARVATRSEQAAADFGAKLQQATAYVQTLSGHEQLIWANEQRLEGNQLYERKMYEEAIDVYLTCLTVSANRDTTPGDNSRKNDDDDSAEQDRAELFFKVMNNLALCTLQLKWYRKTVEFCTMALNERRIDDGMFMLDKAKLFYKRAKASRLRGDYCVENIEKAKIFLAKSNHALEPELNKAIEQERQLLQGAIAQAQVNERRQEASMKRLLSPRPVDDGIDPLYEFSSISEREFSTIRAPTADLDGRVSSSGNPVKSYLEMYTNMMQRQAQQWLDWLSIKNKKSE
jgi:tetratricopeptide (TPR) repeat protein